MRCMGYNFWLLYGIYPPDPATSLLFYYQLFWANLMFDWCEKENMLALWKYSNKLTFNFTYIFSISLCFCKYSLWVLCRFHYTLKSKSNILHSYHKIFIFRLLNPRTIIRNPINWAILVNGAMQINEAMSADEAIPVNGATPTTFWRDFPAINRLKDDMTTLVCATGCRWWCPSTGP